MRQDDPLVPIDTAYVRSLFWAKGISRRELARRMPYGVTAQAVNYILNGKARRCRRSTANAILKVLGIFPVARYEDSSGTLRTWPS